MMDCVPGPDLPAVESLHRATSFDAPGPSGAHLPQILTSGALPINPPSLPDPGAVSQVSDAHQIIGQLAQYPGQSTKSTLPCNTALPREPAGWIKGNTVKIEAHTLSTLTPNEYELRSRAQYVRFVTRRWGGPRMDLVAPRGKAAAAAPPAADP